MNASDIRPWKHISEIGASAPATKAQLEIMRRINDGDRIVPTIGGKGYEFERTGTVVPARIVNQLRHAAWMVEPAYPLFGDRHAGKLTVRGQYALASCT